MLVVLQTEEVHGKHQIIFYQLPALLEKGANISIWPGALKKEF
jgi:hypothetical protein